LIDVKDRNQRAREIASMQLPPLLAEAKAPRYTSYPTAPHFSAAVGAETYAAWLGALAPAATLSLYLHVPFCRELCSYCGCHTKAVRRKEPVLRYAALLRREIELVADLAASRRVRRIHWGGGTPSILGPQELAAIDALLAVTFDRTDVVEHAIELDPRTIDAPLVAALAAMGVNRASLGVQDVSPEVQAEIGRSQPAEQVEAAICLLRGASIEALNLDLMYGLPRQTLAAIRRNVEFVGRVRPDRVSLFGYAHVPWFKPHQRLIDAASLPGAAERLEQAESARRALVALGYRPIGLDHFALPEDELALAAARGALHRNFQGYTTDDADALLGFGASAIGRLPQGYVQNAHDLHAYSRAIRAGALATTKGFALADDDRVRGAAIERLMCDFALDLDAVAGSRAAKLRGEFAERIAALFGADAGAIVRVTGNRIEVSERGRPFVRLIATALDRYLAAGGRHSIAV
jgi:oxygen-independent coproporphyrinogen-3 oxidase